MKRIGILVGLNKGEITTTPLSEVVAKKKQIDMSLLDLAHVLGR